MAGFIGAGALAGNATVAPQAISSHASTAIGDILIAQIINKSVTANAVSPPDGTWTKLIEATNNASLAAHRHQYTIFWKRATVAGAQSYTFTKTTDDNVLFAGVISTFRTIGGGLDPTALATSVNTVAADLVNFPAFDPAGVCHVIYFAWYGLNATTFGSMAGTNPTCTTRYDLESATGTFCTLAATSGDSDPANIASRTWASASTTDAGSTGVVLALSDAAPPVGPSLPLARRVVAQAGGVSGPIVVPSASGSDDIRFASTRTRLNVRQTLLYRSLTSAVTPLAVTDTVSVTQASVIFTGQTVTPIDLGADAVLITAAAVTYTGKPVLVFDTEPITKGSVLFTGQTVTAADATQPGNDDVQFASTRTRLNVRQGLLYRPFTVPGRPLAVTDTVPVTQASVVFTGKTVTVRDAEVTPVAKATVTFTGKSVGELELIPVGKASVTFTGKTVTVRDFEVTSVAKATVTVFGKPITEFGLVPVNKATVIFAGQTVAMVDPGVDRTTVDPAAVIFTGKGVFEREVPVTKGSVLYTGQTVSVRDLDVIPVLKAVVTFAGKIVTLRDTEVTVVSKASVVCTAQIVTSRDSEVTVVTRATVQFSGQSVIPTDLVGDVVPIGRATILFSGQTVLVTDTGEQPPIQPPGGGGGVFVPPWIDYGRKKRRRYRALEEIEKRIDARIEKLKAETKEKQQQVAEVISQPGQIDVLSQQFAELLRQQALITGMLLEAQRRAERVRQERIQLAQLAQIAAFEADEEEAAIMLLLT